MDFETVAGRSNYRRQRRSAVVSAGTNLTAAAALGGTRFSPLASVLGGLPRVGDQESDECPGIMESKISLYLMFELIVF